MKLKHMIIGVGLASLLGIGSCYKLNDVVTKDAATQGQVVSFGKQGLIWDTYEGTFAMGGEQRSVTGYFSLDNEARFGENIEDLAKQLHEAATSRKEVVVYGRCVASSWPWRSSSGCHAYKVEFTK